MATVLPLLTCKGIKCPAYRESAITGKKICGITKMEIVDKIPVWCPRLKV